jgi:hypothetical protein
MVADLRPRGEKTSPPFSNPLCILWLRLPEFAIEGAVLDGFGDVFAADGFAVFTYKPPRENSLP